MLYATHESMKPGSDYTVICKDLKTVRGVKNRIGRRESKYLPGLWFIWKCAESDWYSRNNHHIVGKVRKF